MPETETGASADQQPTASPTSEPIPENGTLIDAGAELVQTVVTYVRQETGDLVHDKVVLPTQKAGGTVALAIGVALVLFAGLMFVSAGALILLASWIGWPAALFAVGGALIIGAAVIALVRTRSMQK
jgi:hypothetical protein